MRRDDSLRCSVGSSGDHHWLEVTGPEDGSQGLRRFTCPACGKHAMEGETKGTGSPWSEMWGPKSSL